MKAVILAAGIGSRLKELTKDKPKCMLHVGENIPLIEYQINKLKENGIKEGDIFVIGGYKIDKLKNYFKDRKVNIIFNPKFKEWNNIYSFFLIKQISAISEEDDFLLLNSDTYFHGDILKALVNSSKLNCIVVDIYKTMGDEEMKVLIEDGRVVKFGKDIHRSLASGEYIGLAKFKKSYIRPLFDKIEELIKRGKTNIWYELAFNYVIDQIIIGYIDTQKKPWIEIDTPEDYEKAKRLSL